MTNDPASGSWHVDRRIPAALIITLGLTFMGQAVGFAWYASALAQRVTFLEASRAISSDQGIRLGRVEVILERVERKLDRLAP